MSNRIPLTDDERKARRKESFRKYRLKNLDKIKEKEKQDRINNPEKHKAKQRKYKEENPEKAKANRKAWTDSNREKIRIQNRENARKRRDEINAYKRKKRLEPEYKQQEKDYRERTKDKNAARTAKRRAIKRLATPKWLTKEDWDKITDFYTESARLTRETGIRHTVDHIIPIQGEFVVGLHVPWNLQILTDEENTSKGIKIIHSGSSVFH